MSKITKVIIAIIIAFIIVGAIQLSANKFHRQKNEAEKKTLKIGVILPLTGPSADMAENAKKGITLALNEINSSEQSKNKIELLFEDSQYKNDAAVTAINKFINLDKIKYIIGDYASPQTLAIAPIAEQNKVILITPTAQAASITHAGDYIFRTQTNTTYEAKYFADFVYKKIGAEPLGIIAINTDYGADYVKDFSERYKELGNNLGLIQKVDSASADFKTELLKIKETGIKNVLLISTRKIGGKIIKQAKELDIEIMFFGTSSIEGIELIEIAENAANGLIYAYPFDNNSDNFQQQNFQNKYEAKHGIKAEMTAANFYDSLMILNNCFNAKGTEVETVKACLYRTRDYSGASGNISFDENGDVNKTLLIKTIENNQFVPYKK